MFGDNLFNLNERLFLNEIYLSYKVHQPSQYFHSHQKLCYGIFTMISVINQSRDQVH